MLHSVVGHESFASAGVVALESLAAAYLAWWSTATEGDPVARFHLEKGARLERLNPLGDLSAEGLKQSFGMMVNYPDDVDSRRLSCRRPTGRGVRARAIVVPR